VELKCTVCKLQACRTEPGTKPIPGFCPAATQPEVLADVRHMVDVDEDTRRLLLAAARTEAEGYCRWPRVQEVMVFARHLGAKHLGIASCVGLLHEADILQKILESNGFQVSSVCCQVGNIPKEAIGVAEHEKLHPGQWETVCNPMGQAHLLNAAGTELNIVVGLCVGHDSVFLRHSQAPATVLVVKDRVTGHNPVAVLYGSHFYYQRLFNIDEG